MDRITYMLGSGASHPNLPIVKDMAEDFITLANRIELVENPDRLEGYDYSENDSRFIRDLKWLAQAAESHASIDTFAKKLYLQNKVSESHRLKHAISYYFVLSQLFTQPNPRYETFWASIIELYNNSPTISNSINILSWNYDSQLEISLANTLDKTGAIATQRLLGVKPSVNASYDYNASIATLTKLNGTAGIFFEAGSEDDLFHLYDRDFNLTPEFVRDFNSLYDTQSNRFRDMSHYLNFAWEDSEISNKCRQHAINVMENTDVVVVIGYSFPTFNRKIDREILKSGGRLKKIYVQDLPDFVGSVKQRVKSLLHKSIEIVPIPDVGQFYVPYELL